MMTVIYQVYEIKPSDFDAFQMILISNFDTKLEAFSFVNHATPGTYYRLTILETFEC